MMGCPVALLANNRVNTDRSSNIGTKSYFMDGLISYGLIFVSIFSLVVYRSIKTVKGMSSHLIDAGISQFWCMVLVMFMVLSLVIYIHGVGFYFYPAMFILLNNVNKLR